MKLIGTLISHNLVLRGYSAQNPTLNIYVIPFSLQCFFINVYKSTSVNADYSFTSIFLNLKVIKFETNFFEA